MEKYINNIASYIKFIEANQPINRPITKFGGNPVWIEQPLWPTSKSTGNPMRFICQVAIDQSIFEGAKGVMAYIFMTDEDEYVDDTWCPESGENAVIIQPGNTLETNVKNIATGPTLESEYGVELNKIRDISTLELDEILVSDEERYDKLIEPMAISKIGGTPIFMQEEEFPQNDDWVLFLQLDSTQTPFFVNFGDCGTGYVFINKDATKGKLLWQCC